MLNIMHYSPFKFQNGDSILQSAIFGKNPEIVKLILDRTVVDPMEKNMVGSEVLILVPFMTCFRSLIYEDTITVV